MIQRAHELLKLADLYRRAKQRRHGVSSAKQALLLAAQRFELGYVQRQSLSFNRWLRQQSANGTADYQSGYMDAVESVRKQLKKGSA